MYFSDVGLARFFFLHSGPFQGRIPGSAPEESNKLGNPLLSSKVS